MASEKMDRRVRKTRSLLLQGLIQLMREKDIKDISVKELSDLADINRGTFYLHYNDIYDMLNKIEDELFQEFNELLDRDLPSDIRELSPKNTLLDIFNLLEKHRDIAKVMIGPHGDLIFVNHLKELVKERLHYLQLPESSAVKPEYYYSFLVSGFVGIIETWLDQPNPLSPEQMAELCSRIIQMRE